MNAEQDVFFTPTAESHGFSTDLLWSGLRSGCRTAKSRRSRSKSAKLSGAKGLPVGLHSPRWFVRFIDNTGIPCPPREKLHLHMKPNLFLKAEVLSAGLAREVTKW